MNKPYYTDGKRTIYLGDCKELLPLLPKQDLCLTDPPYGVMKDTGSAASRRFDDNNGQGIVEWDTAIDKECCEMLKKCASNLMVWGGNHFDLGPTYGWMVWDKQNDGRNFGECEYCWTSLKFAPRIHREWCVNIFGGRFHPTQKPIALMKFCLSLVPEAKTIIDPFMGSGTTLWACKEMNLECIGIETEEAYCEMGAERLRQEVFEFK